MVAWTDQIVDALVEKYIKDKDVVAFGSSELSEKMLKKIAFDIEEAGLKIKIVATSMHLAAIASDLKVPIAKVDEVDIDLAIEFADLVDINFNYIKRDSSSLVRDKMIAQSAEEMIVVAREENYVKFLHGRVPFEIAKFGYKRTLDQLESLGNARLRKKGKQIFQTETEHYIVDVDVDQIYSLEDLDFEAKNIPGVLESGLFIGAADRILLHNGKITVKSRLAAETSLAEDEDFKDIKNIMSVF